MTSYSVRGDWGSTRLRLFRIEAGQVTEQRFGPGIFRLEGLTPEQALIQALADWRMDGPPQRLTLCGMVGARQGWREAPYAACACDARTWRRGALHLTLDGAPVTIGAGLSVIDAQGRPDVMRGEETQIFGALALDPTLAVGRRLMISPGTHSKWTVLEDGVVTGFRTYPTGELFALAREQSSLVGVGAADTEPTSEGFRAGLERISQGAAPLGALFEARSAQLLAARSPAWASGFVSGVLIGAEVSEALRAQGDAAPTLIGEPRLLANYQQALEHFGVRPNHLDGVSCALAGLEVLEHDDHA